MGRVFRPVTGANREKKLQKGDKLEDKGQGET